MRKVGAWSFAATLVVGLSAAFATAGDDESGSAKSSAWAPTWQWTPFGGSSSYREEKPPVEKKTVHKSEQVVAKKPPPAKPTTLVDTAAAERSRQEAALLRRLQACDKLREVAIRTKDKELLRQAEELEERAQAVYAQRTAHLPGANSGGESDSGTDKAGSAESSGYTVSSKTRDSRSTEEVKP